MDTQTAGGATYQRIPLDRIDPPAVPLRDRVDSEKFADLVTSVRQFGVLSPIRVRPKGDRYEVVYGHMRYLAAKTVGLTDIPAIVADDRGMDADLVALEENLTRQDMDPLEEARLYQRLIIQYGLTVGEIAQRRGCSDQYIYNRLTLLKLPEDLLKALESRQIGVSVALELAKIRDSDKRAYYLRQVTDYGASITVLRTWVARTLIEEGAKAAPAPQASIDVQQVIRPGGAALCAFCDEAVPPEQTVGLFLCLPDYRLFQRFKDSYRKERQE